MPLKGILGRLSAKLAADKDDSPFADTEPDVRAEGEEDGDNTKAARKRPPQPKVKP